MNRALIRPSDQERTERLARFRADMAQMDEPEESNMPRWSDWLGGACLAVFVVGLLFLPLLGE